MPMYLKPFLLIQLLAFLTTQVWACLRLRNLLLQITTKLEALAISGYTPIPLVSELSAYFQLGSLVKAGGFFTFTVGFTLGVVAFSGSFVLNRYSFSWPIRLGLTVLIASLFSFLLEFSLVGFLLLIGFFTIAHLLVRIPRAPFHRFALFSLIPVVLVVIIYDFNDVLTARDYLLQNAWGKRVVTFYYRYSPLSAELITPPTERAQLAIWTPTPINESERQWLVKRGIYRVSTKRGADLALPDEARTGPALLDAVKQTTVGKGVGRLNRMTRYSILVPIPVAFTLLLLLVSDALLGLSTWFRVVVLICVAVLSVSLLLRPLYPEKDRSMGRLPKEGYEAAVDWANKMGDRQARETCLGLLDSSNPAARLRAAATLAYLPSRDNLKRLKDVAKEDPISIVRCKAIFALSSQGERSVIPFLESQLRGREDWYVKYYLIRALRRLGWTE